MNNVQIRFGIGDKFRSDKSLNGLVAGVVYTIEEIAIRIDRDCLQHEHYSVICTYLPLLPATGLRNSDEVWNHIEKIKNSCCAKGGRV